MASTIEVYWASRDLAGMPWGNHQFILITIPQSYHLTSILMQTEGELKFITLGAFKSDNGNLIFKANEPNDILSVRETLNPSLQSWYSDFDMSQQRVKAPDGGELAFAIKLIELALKYSNNTYYSPIPYSLVDQNCAAWVNSVFKAAGVSLDNRLSAGEFSGIDWGEEDELDETLFQ